MSAQYWIAVRPRKYGWTFKVWTDEHMMADYGWRLTRRWAVAAARRIRDRTIDQEYPRWEMEQ